MNDRMTDVKVVRGLSPWRPKRPTPEAGNAAGRRLAPSRGPARRPGRAVESRSHAPARPAGSTPASQTSCPGTSAKSPGSPSRLQRPGFNVVRAAPPVPLRGGRPGIWQGDVARVPGRCSSNQKRGVVVTSSEGAFASEFGLTATSELGVSVCVCVTLYLLLGGRAAASAPLGVRPTLLPQPRLSTLTVPRGGAKTTRGDGWALE